jgi:sulfate adenylyltransferase
MGTSAVGGDILLVDKIDSAFPNYHLIPRETRILFKEKGWRTVVGFQTRNVPHIGHEYLQKTSLSFTDGLLINPVIGRKKPGDFKDEVIISTYESLIRNYYLKQRAVLVTLQFEMRYAGPREAILHSIVRKNYGCTHFIVGRDHAGVGSFYPPFAAQEIFDEFPDLGISPLFFRSFFHCNRCNGVANDKTCPHPDDDHVTFSGTKIRDMLNSGENPPEEIMRPEIAEIVLNWENPFVE